MTDDAARCDACSYPARDLWPESRGGKEVMLCGRCRLQAMAPDPGRILLQARSEQFVPLYYDFLALAGDCNRAAYLGLAFFWQRGAGYGEWVEKSATDFAEVLPLSERTQARIRDWLKELGLIEQTRTQEIPTRCLWRLDLEKLAGLVTPAWQCLNHAKLAPPSIAKKKKEEEYTRVTPKEDLFGLEASPSKPKVGPLSKGELAEFEAWYAVYPKHVAKGAGRTAWRKARANFAEGPAGLSMLIELTRAWWEHQRATDGPSLKYVPGPGPWLNQERWADDLEAVEASREPDEVDPTEELLRSAERTRQRYGS